MSEGVYRDSTPDWFRKLPPAPDDTGRLTVEEASLEYAAWGNRGAPGLLLLVGNGAHIGWWRPIAPLLAQDYRVAAFNWSGMGSSDWRDQYSVATFVAEAMAVCDAAGLFDSGKLPILAAHSFGGFLALDILAQHGSQFRGAMLIDSRLRTRSLWGKHSPTGQSYRVHETRELAIARFKLKPDQPESNRFILDMIAEESLEEVAGGWRWRADPEFRSKTMIEPDYIPRLAALGCPLMFVRGEHSTSLTRDIWEEQRARAPVGSPFVEIPDAHHHVMLDQPLALLSVMRALFAVLPKGESWNR